MDGEFADTVERVRAGHVGSPRPALVILTAGAILQVKQADYAHCGSP